MLGDLQWWIVRLEEYDFISPGEVIYAGSISTANNYCSAINSLSNIMRMLHCMSMSKETCNDRLLSCHNSPAWASQSIALYLRCSMLIIKHSTTWLSWLYHQTSRLPPILGSHEVDARPCHHHHDNYLSLAAILTWPFRPADEHTR